MSIIRVVKNKNNPYLIVNKTSIDDNGLSWKATGLHIYLLAKPDDWHVYLSQLMTAKKDGKDSTSSAINELLENGYIIRKAIKNDGKYRGYDYDIYEDPRWKTRNGLTAAEKPDTENPPLLSNDVLTNNKLINNTPPKRRTAPKLKEASGVEKKIITMLYKHLRDKDVWDDNWIRHSNTSLTKIRVILPEPTHADYIKKAAGLMVMLDWAMTDDFWGNNPNLLKHYKTIKLQFLNKAEDWGDTWESVQKDLNALTKQKNTSAIPA